MNSLWIAVHQHSPEDTALAFGHTAAEAARLIADRFPRVKVFVLGRVNAGVCYRVSDDLQDRMLARRQSSGAVVLTALTEDQNNCLSDGTEGVPAPWDWLVQLTPAVPGLVPFAPTYYTGRAAPDRIRTLDVSKAERYPSRAFAEVAARRLLGTLSCMWVAEPTCRTSLTRIACELRFLGLILYFRLFRMHICAKMSQARTQPDYCTLK